MIRVGAVKSTLLPAAAPHALGVIRLPIVVANCQRPCSQCKAPAMEYFLKENQTINIKTKALHFSFVLKSVA